MSTIFTAEAKSLKFLREEKKLEIPFFQRRYVWDEENWKQLHENLMCNDVPGFLGAIILKKHDNQFGANNSVIDGQQRLTTLSLMIIALYDSLDEIDHQETIQRKDDLRNTLYNSEGIDPYTEQSIYKPKLLHSHLDRESFEEMMDLDNKDKLSNIEEGDKIKNCYKYFYNIFKEDDADKRYQLLDDLIGHANNSTDIIVVIGINSDADEQQVFDTLNSAGVKLTLADTIKNYIFDKANQLYKNNSLEEVIKLYDNTWKKTFCMNDEDDKIWSKEITTGRISRTNIDMLLFCFATIKDMYSSISSTLQDLPKVLKAYIDKIDNIHGLNNFLDELCKFGRLYREYFIKKDEEIVYSYDNNNVLSRLLLFEEVSTIKTLNPYILDLVDKYENNKELLNEKLHKVEKLLMYTKLSKDSTRNKNFNKLCVEFIHDEKKIDSEIEECGSMNEGIIGFRNVSNSDGKLLLFLIELYRRKNDKMDISSLMYEDSYQLEHVMPVKWQQNWKELSEYDDNNNKLETAKDKEEYRNKKIKDLGNMTILSKKLNNSISNSDIQTKIEGSGKNQGIRNFVDFKITKDDIVEYYDKNHDWNEHAIEERTLKLYNEFKEAYLY